MAENLTRMAREYRKMDNDLYKRTWSDSRDPPRARPGFKPVPAEQKAEWELLHSHGRRVQRPRSFPIRTRSSDVPRNANWAAQRLNRIKTDDYNRAAPARVLTRKCLHQQVRCIRVWCTTMGKGCALGPKPDHREQEYFPPRVPKWSW